MRPFPPHFRCLINLASQFSQLVVESKLAKTDPPGYFNNPPLFLPQSAQEKKRSTGGGQRSPDSRRAGPCYSTRIVKDQFVRRGLRRQEADEPARRDNSSLSESEAAPPISRIYTLVHINGQYSPYPQFTGARPWAVYQGLCTRC